MQEEGEAAEGVQAEPTPSLFGGTVPIQSALNELRLRLLDLTGRNRLVNFRHTAGKSLQFVHTSIDGVFRRLMADQANRVTITALPEPERSEWVERNGRLARPDPKEYALRAGINPSHDLAQRSGRELAATTSGSRAQTLFYPEDLGKHCRKLEREARLAIEETGANMLYLVLGFLEFPEAPDSDKLFRAPLVCVPVAMRRSEEGRYTAFHLSHTGEELADNLSLREKVKRDFGVNLPEYDDVGDQSVEAYFDAVSDAVATLPNWRVRRMMTLALLSFTNMLLVRDLDPDNWPKVGTESALLGHPLVKQVFEGRPSSDGAQYASEYVIDEHPGGDLPLIFDADSSQHSALIDVLSGQNRVIEGPPGTGKSQTITNLIAAAIQKGKKVLFVAEKLAALEVVKTRLSQAGLDPFVLELHSNKAHKKRVLEDIARRIALQVANVKELPGLLEQHEAKRRSLKAYADLMNSKVGNELDLTLHQVMWRAERHRLRCGPCASEVQTLDFAAAPRVSAAQLAALRDRLRYLSSQLEPIESYGSAHPLWGFFPSEFRPQDDLPVRQTLVDYAQRFGDFASSAAEAVALLGGASLNLSAESAEHVVSLLTDLSPAEATDIDFELLPRLFPDADSQGTASFSVLNDFELRLHRLHDTEADIQRHLLSATPAVESAVTEAGVALAELRTYGLAGCDQSQLAAKRNVLRRAVDKAVSGLAELRAFAELVNLPFASVQSDVHVVQVVADCVAEAPAALLHLRHDGLRSPDAVATLQRGKASLERLLAEQKRLDASLYMDTLPSDAALSEAILTLREGDAWYRIFQKRWRAATGLHRRLERNKSKKRAVERLQDLEALQQLKKDGAAWAADTALRTVTGPHFKGERTPLAELIECARWVGRADAALDAGGVSRAQVDVVHVDRQLVARLAGRLAGVRSACEALKEFDVAARAMLHAASPTVLEALGDADWNARLRTVQQAIGATVAAETLLSRHVQPMTQAEVGLSTLIASGGVRAMEVELNEHAGARALLGERFRGRFTDIEQALATHAYGRSVKRANLPAAIERKLISSKCLDNHRLLARCLDGIRKGWQAFAEFGVAMSKYGRFEPALWTDPAGKTTADFARELANRTRIARERSNGLLAWAQYVSARDDAIRHGLDGFVTRLESGAVPADKLDSAFTYRFYATIAQAAFATSTTLRQFSGRRHSAVQKEFAELDREIIKLRGRQVACDCIGLADPPDGNHSARVDEKTEMRLLEHLIPLQRPRVPVRQMLRRAGRAIQELKPCFMMGPQAVAQFLEPGRLSFDIVVMDEASQLRPEEAIGSVARGSQLVVVGDPKQLPPTSFFTRMALADTDEEGLGQMATSEAESILDVCISHFQPVRTLRWHYRSRHESLIAFSNHHFYRGNLVVFPSPYPKSKALGLRYHFIADGVYENQMNQVEARRVVDAVVEHILHRSGDSLGVVTLNIKQRDLLAELLEERLRSLPEAVAFREHWEAVGQGLFIKNLENVQGDERDCILVSTTFGRPKGADVVRQNFGPISRDGGWRRLNVLFTRARKAVAVFSSMRPEDIVVDERTPEGTRALRHYLDYARTGVLPVAGPTGHEPDSDFEVAVIDVLRQRGYEVTPQLGVAGFRIDIAVHHPDHRSGYLAAVECDGASYHSGVSVRDRDRIRQEILESLGWKGRLWRIWSTDWFRNPLAEADRLFAFLETLRRSPLPEEYLAAEPPEEISVASVPASDDMVAGTAEGLVFEDEEQDLEVEVGDLVAYAPVDSPQNVVHVQLTARQTNPAMGLVAETTPLGAVLLGATVGETVVLRVPGQPPQPFVIQSIKRMPQEAVH